MHTPQTTHLIYVGGTFGSHGTPLSPLPADVFLPVLQSELAARLAHISTHILPNDIIKDSSALTPSDFVALYETLLTAYQTGARRFVIITGTDSLSYLAAFMAAAFADCHDITLIITGSMQPLLIADEVELQINEQSDAWANISGAIAVAQAAISGVFVQFANKTLLAKSTQKIDSQVFDAFAGMPLTPSQAPKTTGEFHSASWQAERISALEQLRSLAKQNVIQMVFALPMGADILAHELETLDNNTKAVIIAAFGAGNLPQSPRLIQVLDKLHEDGITVICTTQCAFGGVNSNYAAGSWQYQHGVLAGQDLSIAGIFGQVLWQLINSLPIALSPLAKPDEQSTAKSATSGAAYE
ncbi:hypothetical protein B0181_09465 [Moraxella caviae]|uniref:L-asparaginase 1 n=1 Tax=Moraxella caviae TaxID=34060 RepID=A0A1S9ZWI7_9GAMM|nr:asparaginase domain-containing protein [Moraxella caviae]OOR87854.1 hypothetical protein B0181_09465 [Moraxella caviae]STZ14888.1 L-asparaginase 1 [Moraxella caviae]VEW11203.1 L-asparaginase 1 [Moraxella caviae]